MKEKIINLNKPVLDLEGNELPNSIMGQILAETLVYSKDGDPLKFFDWALKLHKGETLILDRSDYEKLRDFVKNSQNLPIITKAQILPLLENDKPLTKAEPSSE